MLEGEKILKNGQERIWTHHSLFKSAELYHWAILASCKASLFFAVWTGQNKKIVEYGGIFHALPMGYSEYIKCVDILSSNFVVYITVHVPKLIALL